MARGFSLHTENAAGRKGMARGFVFTLDATLAVIVLSVFAASLLFIYSQAGSDGYAQLSLSNQAEDMLASLGKSGALSSLNQSAINGTVSAALPSAISYRLEVQYYNYSGASGFAPAGNFTLGGSYNASKRASSASRQFVVYQNGMARQYGNAKLWIWAG